MNFKEFDNFIILLAFTNLLCNILYEFLASLAKMIVAVYNNDIYTWLLVTDYLLQVTGYDNNIKYIVLVTCYNNDISINWNR